MGSVSICTKSSLLNKFNTFTLGSLPINSGINPYFTKSRVCKCRCQSFTLVSRPSLNPIFDLPSRLSTTSCRPTKAPPTTNSMFVVSIVTFSGLCVGLFGTCTCVPSMSFKRLCWTPSPETSLLKLT